MNAYAQSAEAYLAQRILSATPEQQAALLMEAGQRFLGRAVKAIETRDFPEMRRCLQRVMEILAEATLRLNHEAGGELVENLGKIYSWWNHELFEASSQQDAVRLGVVSTQMGEIRQAWEELSVKRTQEGQEAGLRLDGRTI